MARYFRRRKFCRFTAEGVKEIDYKDLGALVSWRCCPTRTSTADRGPPPGGCPEFKVCVPLPST